MAFAIITRMRKQCVPGALSPLPPPPLGTRLRTMFECVDRSPETVPASSADTNGALFYHVEVKCNGIPCPPYDTQKEVTCVVCTK